MVLWVGMQFVIVVFPDHTHLLFNWLEIPREAFSRQSQHFGV